MTEADAQLRRNAHDLLDGIIKRAVTLGDGQLRPKLTRAEIVQEIASSVDYVRAVLDRPDSGAPATTDASSTHGSEAYREHVAGVGRFRAAIARGERPAHADCDSACAELDFLMGQIADAAERGRERDLQG